MLCISLNVPGFLLCRLCVLPKEHFQTLFQKIDSCLSFCSQWGDRFPWEAFLDHPSNVLVIFSGFASHYIFSLYSKSPPYEWDPFWECFPESNLFVHPTVSLGTQLTQLAISPLLYVCFWTSWAWNKNTVLLNSIQYWCRKGDPFQGLRLGSCLTLRNELSEETHVLTKQEILLEKGTPVESSRVREPRRPALPHGSQSPVLWWWD